MHQEARKMLPFFDRRHNGVLGTLKTTENCMISIQKTRFEKGVLFYIHCFQIVAAPLSFAFFGASLIDPDVTISYQFGSRCSRASIIHSYVCTNIAVSQLHMQDI